MMIRAVLRHGQIEPVEPLPADWAEGQELVVEQPDPAGVDAELAHWAQEMDHTTAQLSAEEHECFRQALERIERESKDAVRKSWGLT
jgi:uncharacterized membrane protein